MSRYRAIVFDIDGTAVFNHRQAMPTPRLINAVAAAKERMRIFAATGRPRMYCLPVIKALGLTDPCIVGGGTTLIDPVTERVISQSRITGEMVTAIRAATELFPYQVHLPSDAGPDRPVPEGPPETVPYVSIPKVSNEHLTALTQALTHIPGTIASPAPDWDKGHYIQITAADSTKEHRVAEVLRILGVDKADTIGVGDGDNDIHLFAAVGHRIAMGNATEQLKSIADEIAPSITEDGLAWVIEKYAQQEGKTAPRSPQHRPPTSQPLH